jgi:hypothetical protein
MGLASMNDFAWIKTGSRVEVVLDVVQEGDAYRVILVGVFSPDTPEPAPTKGAVRSRVWTFYNAKMDTEAFILHHREGE